MKRLLLVTLTYLILWRSTGRANPPDYLTNDREPADRASQLASPFTEFVTGITYDFSKLGLTGVRAFVAYAYGSMTAGRWEEEINATVDYRITTGPLKNFWMRLRYAHNASSSPVPTEDFRVIFNYLINF